MRKTESIKIVYRFIMNLALILLLVRTFYPIFVKDLNMIMIHWYGEKGSALVSLLYAAVIFLFTYLFDGFKGCINKTGGVVLSQILSLIISNISFTVVLILMSASTMTVGTVIAVMSKLLLEQAIIVVVYTFVFCTVYEKVFKPYSVLIINGDHKNNLTKKFSTRGERYVIDEEVSYLESFEVLRDKISNNDAVIINDVPSDKRNKILKICFDLSKRVYFTPKISDIIVRSSEELNLFDTPLYLCKNIGMSFFQRMIKRLGDIIISLIGIIITSPIMLITAIAINAYDDGPVFYMQDRCTKGGKVFKIMKFRSMIVDAEKDGKARLASANDSRITPIGKFIRATRIDELPQFFNILKGDMSVVGPRPERPEINEKYCEVVPEFAYRLQVKAGLTGYAQVYGKYNTTSYDKLKLDLIYVEKQSLLLDLQLILLTLKVVLTKDATEGVAEGQFTANVNETPAEPNEEEPKDNE